MKARVVQMERSFFFDGANSTTSFKKHLSAIAVYDISQIMIAALDAT